MPTSRLSVAMKVVLALQIAFSPFLTHAADIEIESDIIMRTHHADLNEMVRVGELKAGSVLSIPDRFVIFTNKAPNAELTLNYWLREAGKLVDVQHKPGQYNYDGAKKEYFFPVTIKKAAPGSTVVDGFGEQEIFVALSKMAREDKLLFLSVDVSIHQPFSYQANRQPIEDRTEADAVTQCDNCTATSEQAVNKLMAALAVPLMNSATKTDEKTQRYNGNKNDLARSFQKECGISYESFNKELKKQTKNDPVIGGILQSIIVNESASVGLCKAFNSRDKGAGSWGLFQINAASSKNKSCETISKAEKELGKAGVSNLVKTEVATLNEKQKSYKAAYFQCRQFLQNPINSLKEAHRILLAKEEYLFTGNKPIFPNAENMSKTDRLRLMISAYNGGEKWIQYAKMDLEKFNTVNGTNYSANNWEDLRLFYFRSSLNENQLQDLLHEGRRMVTVKGKPTSKIDERGAGNVLINLAYAETLIPRNGNQLRTVSGMVAIEPGTELKTIDRAVAQR